MGRHLLFSYWYHSLTPVNEWYQYKATVLLPRVFFRVSMSRCHLDMEGGGFFFQEGPGKPLLPQESQRFFFRNLGLSEDAGDILSRNITAVHRHGRKANWVIAMNEANMTAALSNNHESRFLQCSYDVARKQGWQFAHACWSCKTLSGLTFFPTTRIMLSTTTFPSSRAHSTSSSISSFAMRFASATEAPKVMVLSNPTVSTRYDLSLLSYQIATWKSPYFVLMRY